MTTGSVFEFDAKGGAATVIDMTAVERFRADGLLVLRDVLGGEELSALREETGALIERVAAERPDHADFRYTTDPSTGATVPFRVEYVIDKLTATKALLGHPFLLRTVEALQGPAFVPTWDSMVFKSAGAGAAIPWHRDAGLYSEEAESSARGCVFNVDIYLDAADEASCVWGLPGSTWWSREQAAEEIARRNAGGSVDVAGAVPITMAPGDVLVHDVLVLHGSQPTSGPLRRVVYYEFRPVALEVEHGPHTVEYVARKQQVLAAGLRARARAPYAAGETPFVYRGAPVEGDGADRATDPPTWRYAHEDHWRTPWPVSSAASS